MYNFFCMFLQETYEVYDCFIIDKCTQSDHANWSNVNNFSWADNKCTITTSTSLFPRIATRITGDFEATFKANHDTLIRLGMYNADNTSQQRMWNMTATNDEVYYKINRRNGVWTAQSSSDGVTWTNLQERTDDVDLTTEDVYFGFIIATSSERSITFHDLIVYSI